MEFSNFPGLAPFWKEVHLRLAKKQDMIEGMGLSENNFDDAEKLKLKNSYAQMKIIKKNYVKKRDIRPISNAEIQEVCNF